MSASQRVIYFDDRLGKDTEAVEFLKERSWKRGCWAEPFSGRGLNGLTSEFRLRDEFIEKFGFAILTQATIERIRATVRPEEGRNIVEVGSGSGYWAYELNKAGIVCVATDPGAGRYYLAKRKSGENWPNPYLPIERIIGVEAVQKYPDHTLLTVWPDMKEWPAETLEAYTGQTVLYVGEGEGGCTADDRFNEILRTQFEEVDTLDIPQFWGIHDYLQIWRRK